MTPEECRSFLAQDVRTASVATVRPDGRPHVASVWFELDDDALVFTSGAQTVKATNLRHDPRVCIVVDDETPPFAYVQVEGTASFSENPAELLYWATRIGGKYMGADQAEAYGKRNGVPGELLVRVRITRLVGEKDIAGW